MRQPTPRRWQAWRVTPVTAPGRVRPATTPEPIARRLAPTLPAELRAEAPGADGVRHGLVAKVKELIAAGAYDAPDRWDAAEDRLLDRVLGGR